MGGRIWVESEVGRGSRFHFTVRLGRADAEPDETADAEPVCLHGMRVLVVDDNATNRRILDEVLSSWQMLPTSVASAAQALEHLRQAEHAGQPFPLVITDAHMPDIDGFMLARQIRDERGIDGPVIMMLTSGDRPNDMGECERLGIAAYLLKPIKQSELLEAIELALGILGTRAGASPARARTGGVPRGRSLRILLAEDSLVNQQLAVALLESEGHTVTVANNGREAVAAAETGGFDLVLMDLQMPEMDGLEATAMIRANEREAPAGRHLPIIAMTAHALKGDRERCLEAGMDGYTSKPIDAEELFAAIESSSTPAGGDVALRMGPDRDAESGRGVRRSSHGCRPRRTVDDRLGRGPQGGSRRRSFAAIRSSRPPWARFPNLLAEIRRAAAAGDCPGPPPGGAHAQRIDPLFRGPARAGTGPAAGGAWARTIISKVLARSCRFLDQSAGQLMAALAERMLTGNTVTTAVDAHEVTP